MKRAVSIFGNKYFLSAAAFLAWMLFFDHNDFMSQWDYHKQLRELREQKEFYLRETQEAKKELDELNSNKESLERFARERYHMKKANEDVYVIVAEKKEEKKSLF